MKLRKLGNSGLRVSDLCLGTMNFGMREWGVGEEEGLKVFKAYFDAGGNFIDTADVYSKGTSEEICAKAIKGRRDQVILATKGHFPVTARFGDPPEHANALGSSRRHLTEALNDSLKRLKTDYIDLYQTHCWDAVTPIEETLSTLDDFVRAGKVRYIGLSNYVAWQIVEARQLCIRFNWEPYITAQMQYSLICRDVESGVVPVCHRYGIGLLPWSPLGGGVLAGKYNRDLKGPRNSRFGDKLDETNEWRNRFVNQRNVEIAETVKAAAKKLETTPTALSIAWLLGRPTVSSVIIGPKSVAQLKENLAADEVDIPAETLKQLDKISAPVAPYPAGFIAATYRNMEPAKDQ
ncbi:MAG TPA: aldo/keto reductase [Phycisphaerae bacterium]|nr:aldo/keto reductase [Phycisphaerae bacterium]